LVTLRFVIQGEPQATCVDDEAALDFVRGRLPEIDVKRIDQHADGCESCRLALAEAARAFREHWTDSPVTPSVPITRFVPGDMLSGRYRIVRFIARGGMGEVYEAYDLILNTRLAVKTLAATISDDPNAIRRLKQEVNFARLITHPNVCRIFDLGVHEQSGERPGPGVLFITMELVPGISLGERVRTMGRLSVDDALPIARAIVAGLGAAHRAGVVHRDLKSDNVMLAPDGQGGERPVVMDFGLARGASRAPDLHSTDGPMMAGTLAYMAPEQLEGTTIGEATDIYALGIVMFEMLTGELPFKGEPALSAAWKRVSEPAPSVGALAPGVGSWLQRLVAACLERDPARRPGSAQEIERMLQGPDAADPAESLAHAPPPASLASRARMAFAAAALLGGAAAGVWLVARSTHSGVASGAERKPAPTAPAGERFRVETPGPIVAVPPLPAMSGPLTNVAVRLPPEPVKLTGPKRKPAVPRAAAIRKRVAPGGPNAVPVGKDVQQPTPGPAGPSNDPDDGFIIPSR